MPLPLLLRRIAATVVDPHRIRGLATLPRFIADWRALRRAGTSLRLRDLYPQLGDRLPRTPFDPHYVLQAGWLARRIAERRPALHVDVGSDVRLIATLSAFVPVEFIDLRPPALSLPGLTCRAGDARHLDAADASIASLSCLHVIEHVGLGRYGDPIDPEGHAHAARELVRALAPGGRLYVSTPVGRPRIEFNAHRVFDAEAFAALFAPLRLAHFAFVDDGGELRTTAAPTDTRTSEYACGLFEFTAPGGASP
ncbi:MAG: DUF268 domain-containing protein [Phycisphaerales bacterium]